MKFIVQKSVLLDVLTITGKCISKSMLPIMECYLFKIDNNKLVIIGGNLEVYLEKQIDIKSEIKKDIALPSARLYGLIKDLTEQPIMFTIDTNTIKIEASCGNYTIPFYDAVDYQLQTNKEEIKFDMLSEDLLAGVGKTTFACIADHTRPAMTRVSVSFYKNQVTYTGTNAHILAIYSYDVDIKSEKSFIVPVKVLSILLGLIPNTRITIKLDNKSIVFEVNHSTVLKSRLIDEKYPDYIAVIQKDNDKVLNVGRYELLGSLQRVAQFCDDSFNTVKLNISDNKIAISAENSIGEFANETLNMQYTGEETSAKFNGKMLISCLKNLTAEMISFSFKSPQRAFLVRSDEASEQVTTNLMLLMPLGK
ncbi:DNA polymerase III subunit beta [Mucilaginibacter sp. L196]|uniref:DNA polymerase III subunit beta n=1 Tax=Mucilaginibacter sp. L196 TaxID=1641870 RepID=UPI00131AB866|nr:DNA polymerase III subunit beta [Mucilaginibacter sp. L196]